MARRILSAQISHETNTFSLLPTTLEAYKASQYYRDADIAFSMGGTNTEMAAHIDAAKRYGWDLVQPISAFATPGGKVTKSAWAHFQNILTQACERGPFDGVLLALHGSMVCENEDDAEGALLRLIREKLGHDIPIAVTLDLHANVSDTMCEYANIIIAFRTYPHIDLYDVAAEAADLLERTMNGEIRPQTRVFRGALIYGCDRGRTQSGIMVRLLEKAARYQQSEPDLLEVAICAGFAWSDVYFVGPSVTITTNGKSSPRHIEIAEELMADIWEARYETSVRYLSLPEVINKAQACGDGSDGLGPLVIGDATDNPGSGAYGDNINLLRAMLEANLPNAALASIPDPQSAQQCIAAGIGTTITLELGSKVDPSTYGPPLTVTGIVENITNGMFKCDGPMMAGLPMYLGPTAVVRVGGVRIIVGSDNVPAFDKQIFVSQGIDPRSCSVLAVKSLHHFRASFEPIAREIILADSGSLVSMNLKSFIYHQVRRPVWPLDMD